jgi:hypothetical protein
MGCGGVCKNISIAQADSRPLRQRQNIDTIPVPYGALTGWISYQWAAFISLNRFLGPVDDYVTTNSTVTKSQSTGFLTGPSPAMGGLQIPRWLGSDPLSAWWLGLVPATLEFWVRFPYERNQGKQAIGLYLGSSYVSVLACLADCLLVSWLDNGLIECEIMDCRGRVHSHLLWRQSLRYHDQNHGVVWQNPGCRIWPGPRI